MSAIKKVPASPLPFVLRGNAKHGEIIGGRGSKRVFVDEIPFEAWGDDARRLRADWRYLLHAGNAYPELVRELQSFASGPGGMRAQWLLRKLGEEVK